MADSLLASPGTLCWSTVASLPAGASIVIHGTNRKAQLLKSEIERKRPDIRIKALIPCDIQSDAAPLPDFSAEFGQCDAVTNQSNWIQTAWRFLESGCRSLHVLPVFDPSHTKRTCIVIHSARVIFVPNFKCAYSSFAELFRQSFDEFSKAASLPDLKSYADLLDDTYKGFFKFSVVRNPLRRAVSCFKDKYEPHNRDLNLENWQIPLLKLLEREKISFVDWLKFIASMPDEYSDPHWRSQYYTMHTDDGQQLVDAIYKLEHLCEHQDELSDRLGVSARLQRLNSTTPTFEPDGRALDIVKRRYEKDFRTFDY
jgi:hypothetical protein